MAIDVVYEYNSYPPPRVHPSSLHRTRRSRLTHSCCWTVQNFTDFVSPEQLCSSNVAETVLQGRSTALLLSLTQVLPHFIPQVPVIVVGLGSTFPSKDHGDKRVYITMASNISLQDTIPTGESHGPLARSILWVMVSVSAVFLGLRIFCKFFKNRRLWWDDYVLIASWVRDKSYGPTKDSTVGSHKDGCRN